MTRENTVNVPRKPTPEMIEAGERAAWDDNNSMPAISAMRKAYAAMLSAAPLHEGEGEPVAYEIRNRVGGDWKRVHHALYCSALDRPNLYEARPLYAAPPPSVPRMLVDQEWLARRVENEPEGLDCEVVPPSVEVERLEEIRRDVLALCVGHPAAKIAWPHRELHAIADRLAALSKEEPGVPTPGGEG